MQSSEKVRETLTVSSKVTLICVLENTVRIPPFSAISMMLQEMMKKLGLQLVEQPFLSN